MQKVIERLDDMVGQTFVYNARHHKVLTYKLDSGSLVVVTDKKWIEFDDQDHLVGELDKFLPAATDSESGNGKLTVIQSDSSQLSGLAKTVMDNIKKIQEDKGYIPQANAINGSINTLVNMAKLELQLQKLKNGAD